MAEKTGIFKPKGRPCYYVRTDPITGGKVSTGKTSHKEAIRWLVERKQEAERRAKDPTYAATTASFAEQCDIFLDSIGERGRSNATLGMYAQKLGHWVRVLGEDATMADVTQINADRFVSTRRKEGASEHTIFKECAKLCQMLKGAKRRGVWFGDIDTLIPEDVKPNYVPRSRALTIDEIDKLVAACSENLGDVVAICAGLGVRLSEVPKVASVGSDGLVTVNGTKTVGSKRQVPLLSIFEHLILPRVGRMPVSVRNNISRDLKAACRRAGIVHCSPNDLRRSFATILLEHGVTPDVARRCLGHSSENMLRQIYGRTRPTSLREQAEAAIARTRGDKMGTVGRYGQRSLRSAVARKSSKTQGGNKSHV